METSNKERLMIPSLKAVGLCCLGLALPLMGCGSGSTADNVGSPSAPSNASSGSVLVKLSAGLAKGEEPLAPSEIESFVIDVLNADGVTLLPTTRVPGDSEGQEVLLQNVPLGRVRVLVRAEGQDGETLGTRETEVEVTGFQVNSVLIDALIAAGQTREIGLVSVGSNGQASGASTAPSITEDGRQIAFASRADLVSGGPDPGTQQIFVRDRLFNVLSRVSIRDSGSVFPSDCFEPDISADGRYVVFRNGTSAVGQGQLFVRDRGTGSAGAPPETFSLQAGSKPRISANGNFVVFESSSGVSRNIILRRVTGGLVEGINRNAANEFSDGLSSKPCISGDGRFVVFHSTATDLIPGGTPGIYLRDRQLLTTTRLPIPDNLDDTSITPDGNFVLASTPGQTPFLLDRSTGLGTSLTAITGLVGKPGLAVPFIRFQPPNPQISFFSSSSALIDNDLNQQTDAFVLDTQSGEISRINVSNDGTSVFGRVDETSPQAGPAISANGRRIAFSAPDRDLVPNGSGQLDVYSATNPTGGLLYVISGNEIQRYSGANLTNGTLNLVTAIKGGSTQLAQPQCLFLDITNDRLYVACLGDVDSNRAPAILVFNQVSTKFGNVAPNRVITGLEADDMVLDGSRNILYLVSRRKEVVAISNASNVNGVIPASGQRRFQLTAQNGGTNSVILNSMLLDARLDEMYLAGRDLNFGQFVSVVRPASTSVGIVPFRRRLFGSAVDLFPAARLGFDTSPRSFQGGPGNDASLVVLDVLNRISTFVSNGSRSGFIQGNPTSVVPSTSLPIIINPGTPKATNVAPSAGFVFDSTTNLRYVGDHTLNAVQVFRSNPTALQPDRVLLLTPPIGASNNRPIDIALDRTR